MNVTKVSVDLHDQEAITPGLQSLRRPLPCRVTCNGRGVQVQLLHPDDGHRLAEIILEYRGSNVRLLSWDGSLDGEPTMEYTVLYSCDIES